MQGRETMITAHGDLARAEHRELNVARQVRYETWVSWPVNWTATWVGALTAFALLLILGLVGIAVGAHLLAPENRVVDLKKLTLGALAFSVVSSFLAFVAGGWVAGKVGGVLRSEPAMLHGGIVWLLCVPVLLVAAALGAGNFLGAWHSGLAGTPAWGAAPSLPFKRPDVLSANAAEAEWAKYRSDLADYHQKVNQWNEDTPKVTRNSALSAVTALLLGLVGAVLGGWMASGEPMTFTYYRHRKPVMADNLDAT
jgi:hypothetical protein